jgi:hypothetical protein
MFTQGWQAQLAKMRFANRERFNARRQTPIAPETALGWPSEQK